MLTVQCTDVSQSVCAYLILMCSIQNTTDLRGTKKERKFSSYISSFFFFFFLLTLAHEGLWKQKLRYKEEKVPHVLGAEDCFASLFE